MEEKKYIVYKHTTPNGKVYIGITCQKPNARWKNGNGYNDNDYFYKAIKKYGWENIKHEILFNELDIEQAEEIEKSQIELYKSNQREYGYNIQNGGVYNRSQTEETKRKISEANKGEVCWWKGKKLSEEHKKNLSKARKGMKFSEEHIKNMSISKKGKVVSEETKLKMREAHAKTQYNHSEEIKEKMRKVILQYSLSGEFIKKYNSLTNASIETGIDSGAISRVCKNKRNKAGGFIWRYANG